MTNEELIAEVREIATNDRIWRVYARERVLEMANVLSASQEAAQARVVELEATTAVLAEASQDFLASVDNMSIEQFQTGWGLEELGVLRTTIANLPQAVQRHLARDRRVERFIEEAPESVMGHCLWCAAFVGEDEPHQSDCSYVSVRAAYRSVPTDTVGGEGSK